jgi:hypothetical protein
LKVLDAGLNLWKALNGSEIKINDIPFKVNFITTTTTEASQEEAKKKFDVAEYTNLYSGNNYANGDPVPRKRLVTAYTISGDVINGATASYKAAATTNGNMIYSNIAEIVNTDFSSLTAEQKGKFADFLKAQKDEIDYGKDPVDIAHEVGHTLGLNHNGAYNAGKNVKVSESESYTSPFDPNGVMSDAHTSPTLQDLKNIIIEALQHRGRSVFTTDSQLKIEISDETLKKVFTGWDGKAESKSTQADLSKAVIK